MNMNSSLLDELRQKAFAKRDELYSQDSSEEEIKYAEDTLHFLENADNINKVPKSTIFSIFRFLGYTFDKYEMVQYNQMYDNLLEEINKVYILADEADLTR